MQEAEDAKKNRFYWKLKSKQKEQLDKDKSWFQAEKQLRTDF